MRDVIGALGFRNLIAVRTYGGQGNVDIRARRRRWDQIRVEHRGVFGKEQVIGGLIGLRKVSADDHRPGNREIISAGNIDTAALAAAAPCHVPIDRAAVDHVVFVVIVDAAAIGVRFVPQYVAAAHRDPVVIQIDAAAAAAVVGDVAGDVDALDQRRHIVHENAAAALLAVINAVIGDGASQRVRHKISI